MSRRIWVGAIAMCGVLALPASSLAAGATRTWVSGVGSDANPCSRTAPCATFAGALAQTAPGGEIDALDPGDFGPLTINQAVTIDGGGGQVAGAVLAGSDGIQVAAGPADHVILRNLRIDGQDQSGGLTGINFISGGSLRIENSQIFGFARSGVLDASSTSTSSLVISGSNLDNNGGDGVLVAPPAGAAAQALVETSSLQNNACGIAVGGFGANGTTPNFASDCGTASSGPAAKAVTVGLSDISAAGNSGVGVLANGTPSTVFLSDTSVFGNSTGLEALNGGAIIAVGSDNSVYENGSNGSPTASLAGASPGVAGPTGAPGPTGSAGVPAKVVVVSCRSVLKKVKVHGKPGKKKKTKTKKIRKCTARTVTSPFTFTVG